MCCSALQCVALHCSAFECMQVRMRTNARCSSFTLFLHKSPIYVGLLCQKEPYLSGLFYRTHSRMRTNARCGFKTAFQQEHYLCWSAFSTRALSLGLFLAQKSNIDRALVQKQCERAASSIRAHFQCIAVLHRALQ